MVKQQDLSIAKTHDCKGISKPSARASKINASTAFDTCREQLSPFGGLLALIKFLVHPANAGFQDKWGG